MHPQSALGEMKVHRQTPFGTTKIGKVAGTKDYKEKGFIDVIFIDYSASMPVWVVGEIDKEPQEDDMVIVGYMEGRKDAPYLVAYVRNESYNCNNIIVGRDYIRIQLPADKDDRKEKMLKDDPLPKRPYIEIKETDFSITINTPKKVEVIAENANVKVKETVKVEAKNADIKVTELAKVEAKTITVKASAGVSIEGATVGIKSSGAFTVTSASTGITSSGAIAFQGGSVTANGEDLTHDDIGSM